MKPQIAGFLTGASLVPGFWFLQGALSDAGHAETLVDQSQPHQMRGAGAFVASLPEPAFGAQQHAPAKVIAAAKVERTVVLPGQLLRSPAMIAQGSTSSQVGGQPAARAQVQDGSQRLAQSGSDGPAAVTHPTAPTRTAAATLPSAAGITISRDTAGPTPSAPSRSLVATPRVAVASAQGKASAPIKTAQPVRTNDVAVAQTVRQFYVEDLPLLRGPVITVGTRNAVAQGEPEMGAARPRSTGSRRPQPVLSARPPVVEYLHPESKAPGSATTGRETKIANPAATPQSNRPGPSLLTDEGAATTPPQNRIDPANSIEGPVQLSLRGAAEVSTVKAAKAETDVERVSNARSQIPSPLFGHAAGGGE